MLPSRPPSPVDTGLYAFHKASIHERRFMAKLCAAFPLLFLMMFCGIVAYGLFHKPIVLLVLAATLNTCYWLWISSTALLSIAGAFFVRDALRACSPKQPCITEDVKRTVFNIVDDLEDAIVDTEDKAGHLIVLPNFKEDEAMLAETLHSLAESKERSSLFVVLAMEEREPLAQRKGERLKELFAPLFHIVVTVHPMGLQQTHMDGSEDEETPGKASNLKWAVPTGFQEFQKKGYLKSMSSVIVTVADADCIFHPDYFSTVSREFNMLRENPGADHLWTMWQAPQLPYRNFYESAACSRIWGYISSAYETGGVAGLSFGGKHMVFSGYSLSLQMAMDAGAWDGDVIAEDHHAFLKCFFYSAHTSSQESLAFGSSSTGYSSCGSRVNVRPVYLPVKATSVSAPTYWRTWVERFHQARRHAQGISELSYAILVAFDAFSTLPWKLQSLSLHWQVSQVILRLWCMHLLPMCQAIALAGVTVMWLYHGTHIPHCFSGNSMFELKYMNAMERGEYVVCSLAGARFLVLPVLFSTFLVILASYLLLNVSFLQGKGGKGHESIWQTEDGGAAKGKRGKVATFTLISFDLIFLVSAVMIPYGFIAEVAAYIDVAIHGNRVKYHTASKPPALASLSYGTMCNQVLQEPALSDTQTAPSGASSTCSRERSASLSHDADELSSDGSEEIFFVGS